MQGLHPDPRRPATRILRLALVSVAASTIAATPLDPFVETGEPPNWGEILRVYVEDPFATGDQLVTLTASSPWTPPPPVRLALADVYVRRGRFQDARDLLRPLADTPSAWSGFASLGLGMIGASGRELSDAADRFALAARFPGLVGQAATMGGAQVAAARGDPAQTRAILASLRTDSRAPRGLRRAAELVAFLSLLQEDRYVEALAGFDALASLSDDSLSHDARYGAAQALLRMGDLEGARLRLTALVEDCPTEGGEAGRHPLRALRRLQPRAVMRAWLRNYRRLPFTGTGSGAVFRVDGCALAREQLAEWTRDDASSLEEDRAVDAGILQDGPSARHAADGRDPDARSKASRSALPLVSVLLIFLVVAAAAVGLAWRARASRP